MKILSKKVQKNIWDRSMGISKKVVSGRFTTYIFSPIFCTVNYIIKIINNFERVVNFHPFLRVRPFSSMDRI